MISSAPLAVLLIEDSNIAAMMIERMLVKEQNFDCVVSRAADLASGCARLQSESFDVVLLDLFLPDSEGLDTFRHTQKAASGVPIIVLTGIDDNEVAAEAVREGAQDFISKSTVKPDMLVRAIRYAIERKRVEQDLLSSKQRYQSLYNQTPGMLYSFDRYGRIVSASDYWLEIMGYDREEVTGQRSVNFMTPEAQHDALRVLMPKLMDEGTIKNQPLQFVKKQGEVIDVLVSATVEANERGEIEQCLAVLVDVTEQKRAQQALKQERAFLDSIIENIPVQIFVKSAKDLRFVRYNRAAEEMVGLTRDEVIGKTDFDFLEKEQAEYFRSKDREVLAQGFMLDIPEESINTRHKGTRLLHTRKIPIFNTEGVPEYLLGISEDITERKRSEEQLVQAQKLESIGQLAAGIAHEINTPIQYIGDNTRFLQDSFTDLMDAINSAQAIMEALRSGQPTEDQLAEAEERFEIADIEYLAEELPMAIEQSLEGIDRVAHIVRAMKEFSHPGQEEKSLVDLNRALETTITVARSEWKYLADMVKDFDPNLPQVPCLPGELNQVFLNIIVNAAHAIESSSSGDGSPKGTITIKTRAEADFVEVRISDTGTGIPEGARARIFDPFFTTKSVGKGTGQGLSIAYNVIKEKHQGTLSFETETGVGTTFIIQLPLQLAGQA